MPISAVYSPALRSLAVFGDDFDENIVVSRDLAGTLFVNGGAVPISGGVATVGNTDLVEASASISTTSSPSTRPTESRRARTRLAATAVTS